MKINPVVYSLDQYCTVGMKSLLLSFLLLIYLNLNVIWRNFSFTYAEFHFNNKNWS